MLYPDLANGRGVNMPGYAKIQGCCAQAKKDDYEWVWIDSCCIDKTSSAELSEAMNSMYQWYKNARVCYAFLSDVDASFGDGPRYLESSAWFARGWTLQELLAPEDVVLFDMAWTDICTKRSLRELIAQATGIRVER